MASLPRELHVWLTSLNLSYKINNPKRDLSNGYVFAEIFNRYFPDEIEMYTVDNGFKLAIKQNNWEFLQRFFNKKKIPITLDDYDPVMHMAPGTAYNLLKKIYSILNEGKEIEDTTQNYGDEEPYYAKPTISKKVKDHELQRIGDMKTQTDMAKTMITDHNDMLRTERLDPNRFTKTKRGFGAVNSQQASAHALSQMKKKTKGKSKHGTIDEDHEELRPEGDIKEVQVKTANKSIRIMRQEAAAKRDPTHAVQDLDDSDDMRLDSVLIDIVSHNIDSKMSKGDPEYKIFKENYHRILDYFTERMKNIPDDLLHEIFSELNDRLDELVAILNKNLSEFCDLSQFICQCLMQLNPMNTVESVESSKNKNIFLLLVQTLATIGNKLLNFDPLQVEMYFLEYTIDDLIEVIGTNMFKCNEMIYLFYCFVPQTVNSHLRVLTRLKDKIEDRDVFYYSLSKLLVYESLNNEDLDADLYSFYFQGAAYGLLSTSTITRTKCVTILAFLSKVNSELIINLLPRIEPLVHNDYWELQGQILILCSNCLIQFNAGDEEPSAEIMNIHDNSQLDMEDQDGVSEEQFDPNAEESKMSSPVQPRQVDRPADPAIQDQVDVVNEDPNAEQMKTTSQQETMLRLSEEYTPLIFRMIEAIFRVEAPKATLKVGLIYLAKILHFYPEFTDLYLQILLAVPDVIRTAVVDCHPLPGTEEEVYVSGCSTEKYRTFGAPLEWNPLFVAQSLEKYIKDNKLENLEWPHIEIFEACLQQEFYDEDIEKWLKIFSSLKSYFFISLCYRDFSSTTIEILKKIYTNNQMQGKFIEESKSIFVKTMKLIYQPDVEYECQENVKEFLEYLHTCENSTPALQKMVYDVIKFFADHNKEAFQKSNLIDLTVQVVENKRGAIFTPQSV